MRILHQIEWSHVFVFTLLNAAKTHPVRTNIKLLVLDDFISILMPLELRQARRDRQLVSRRLLPGEDEDQADVAMDTKTLEEVECSFECYFFDEVNEILTVSVSSFCQDVFKLFHKLLHSGSQKEVHLKSMSKVLQNPSAQLTFIK